MELLLEGTEGVPDGGILSIKAGDVKRQAPASKLGQAFRFSSLPTNSSPLKVELLLPAAEPQLVKLEPGTERYAVDFGRGIKVTLQQRDVRGLQRPAVDIGEIAEGRGLPSEKLQMAQTAAGYLEKHDLVRLFQDLLHGLLVSKPEDPMSYIESRLVRPRTEANSKKVELQADPKKTATPTAKRASRASARSSVRSSMRESTRSLGKVDTLLLTLQSTRDNLDIVIPFVPAGLREMLMSEDLANECMRQFEELDTRKTGKLKPEELLPLICELSNARQQQIPLEKCQKLVDMFDVNEDGFIQAEEFTTLLQFVIITSYVTSPEGAEALAVAKVEKANYRDFLKMIENDIEKLWSIIPFLPEWLVTHVSSPEFMALCIQNFRDLDKDGNGSLEPMELVPVIKAMCDCHPLVIDYENCKQFVNIFDSMQTGMIVEEEFIEFAQFITVMNFLTSTDEGRQVAKQGSIVRTGASLITLVETLANDPETVEAAMQSVPKVLVDELKSTTFEQKCRSSFQALDKTGGGKLSTAALVPVIVRLVEAYPFRFDLNTAWNYRVLFTQQQDDTLIDVSTFFKMARYSVIMAYLVYASEHQDMLVQEVLLGKEKVQKLLDVCREGVSKIESVIPFLPEEVKAQLLSAELERECEEAFADLDKDGSGVLEPTELLPVVMRLSSAHQFATSEEHARQFVSIFDVEKNGVITKAEHLDFVRFMLIMAYLETEAGALIQQDINEMHTQQLNEWLDVVTRDRDAVRKIVPLLPKHVFDELTSDDFIRRCHERFERLDRDRTGVLRPQELVPLVVDLTSVYPCVITEEHSKRFTNIFDIYGDGVLRPDEFLDFLRFLMIMGYLQSEEGKAMSKEALTIIQDSKRVEDLLQMLHCDRRQIQVVLPYLPAELCDELLSDRFVMQCLETFVTLDKDNNGKLTPAELHPLIVHMAGTHALALSNDQCARFTAIFDEAGDGVIHKTEFVNFCRFHMIMCYLSSQEGQKVVDLIKREEAKEKKNTERKQQENANRSPVPHRPEAPMPTQRPESANKARRVPSAPKQSVPNETSMPHVTPAQTHHLAVDCQFYQTKAEKLKAENDAMRARMLSLEDLIRKLEGKLEEAEFRLRHAEVDLSDPSRAR
mmetsp:Transcript_118413/g.334719  ORF Transcript_118413/g.334719 Transcript_118413/m.334719 type:complete len:1122 (+) Transcript_118413:32-3397(+)